MEILKVICVALVLTVSLSNGFPLTEETNEEIGMSVDTLAQLDGQKLDADVSSQVNVQEVIGFTVNQPDIAAQTSEPQNAILNNDRVNLLQTSDGEIEPHINTEANVLQMEGDVSQSERDGFSETNQQDIEPVDGFKHDTDVNEAVGSSVNQDEETKIQSNGDEGSKNIDGGSILQSNDESSKKQEGQGQSQDGQASKDWQEERVSQTGEKRPFSNKWNDWHAHHHDHMNHHDHGGCNHGHGGYDHGGYHQGHGGHDHGGHYHGRWDSHRGHGSYGHHDVGEEESSSANISLDIRQNS